MAKPIIFKRKKLIRLSFLIFDNSSHNLQLDSLYNVSVTRGKKMPIFFEGVLLILMIFSFCVGIAIICQFARFWYENKNKPKQIEVEKTKIYYVKETQTKQKTKKKKRYKKPEIALKGIVLSPEQFELINVEKTAE